MHPTPRACAVIILSMLLAAACGSTAPEPPTAPTPQLPSLLGHWTGTGRVDFSNSPQGEIQFWGCSTLDLSIDAQQDREFSGSMRWQGNGSESDKRCFFGGTFTALLASDRTFTLRLSSNGKTVYCTRLSGESVFRGTVTADMQLEGQMTDRAACSDNDGRRSWEADRTFSFNMRRVCAGPACSITDEP